MGLGQANAEFESLGGHGCMLRHRGWVSAFASLTADRSRLSSHWMIGEQKKLLSTEEVVLSEVLEVLA